MSNGTFIFDEQLYQKNIEENEYPDEGKFEGLSEECIQKLREDGLLDE